MTNNSRVEDFLAHYADQYYNPEKAHEYYLENRQLTGRQPAAVAPLKSIPKPPGKETPAQAKARAAQNKIIAATNRANAAARKGTKQRQTEALAYANKEIGAHKKADSAAVTKADKARVTALHNKANGTKTKIEQGLKAALAKIDAAANIKLDVPKLNVIPADASPAQKQFLQEQNHKLQARSDAKNRAAQKVANGTKSQSTKQQNAKARAQKVKIANDLKAAIAQARKDYANAKKHLNENYTQISAHEKANIKANVH